MIVLVLVQTVLLVVLTVLVAGLLRAHGAVLRRLHQLDGGASFSPETRDFAIRPAARAVPASSAGPAPAVGVDPAGHDVSGETPDGELVTVRVADVDHDTLLLFLSSRCEKCLGFWQDLHRPVQLPPATRLLVVGQSDDTESPSELARLAAPGVDVVLSSDAWRDYGVPGSPYAVYVEGRSGRVHGEGTGQSLDQVARLLAQATGNVGFLVTRAGDKPNRDAEQEAAVDRALLAAGILPGDPRLYGEQP